LDGRPDRSGKPKITAAARHAAFWGSTLWATAPAAALSTEAFVLALTQYLQQKHTAAPLVLHRVATETPDALCRAVRYSLVFVSRDSERWMEVDALDPERSGKLGAFLRVCDRIDREHRELLRRVEVRLDALGDMPLLDAMAYASLFAFERLVPSLKQVTDATQIQFESAAEAIGRLLAWAAARSTDQAFQPSASDIASSMRRHLIPFLLPTPNEPPDEARYIAFKQALIAQVDLDAYRSRWVQAFAFDDESNLVLVDGQLERRAVVPDAGKKWQVNGQKIALLHSYWFRRAVEELLVSGSSEAYRRTLGNDPAVWLANLRARRDWLHLNEVYGMDATVHANNGMDIDLFHALRTLELFTAFFTLEFVQPFLAHLDTTGDWRAALRALALRGAQEEAFHLRFPLTWADHREKVQRLQPWTATAQFPMGNAKATEAVLDFWTFDLALHRNVNAPRDTPHLHERPILKIGRFVFQLPWMLAAQNNATAAINNLRRLGSRRSSVGDETRRIELRLAERFSKRGFAVIANYQPDRTDEEDPGEVDVICARDGHLWVLELKSTFVRKSLEDAWRHRTTTLRKAGMQLKRKVSAVARDLSAPEGRLASLGLGTSAGKQHAWIVDTSLEHDHEHIGGHLKVSMQEVLIALRDDRHLLRDLAEPANGQQQGDAPSIDPFELPPASTLYPQGFTGAGFAEAIESGAVWGQAVLPVTRPE